MKCSMFKKFVAMLLIMSIAVSTSLIGVSAVDDPPAAPVAPVVPVAPAVPGNTAVAAPKAPNVWVAGIKNFGVTKVYATGLVAVGAALTYVAKLSECEEFEKIASIINVWVCGGNPTTQTLADIQALCTEILTEVKQIEAKMDAYANYFSTKDAQDKYEEALKEMDEVWEKDVIKPVVDSGLSGAMSHFFEYEDARPVSKGDTNTQIGYVVAASCYKEEKPDKYGKYYTEEAVNKKRQLLFDDFCALHKSMPASANTSEKKADILFADRDIDAIFQQTLQNLAYKINPPESSYSYADKCALVAYKCFPNLADQYDFVMNGINKQFMQICMVEMLYQEYLAMRGEYLEYKYPDDEERWDSYREDVALFVQCNEEIKGYMENRLSDPMYIDSRTSIALEDYVKPSDMKGVVLKNTQYLKSTDSDDIPNTLGGHTTNANASKEYVSFRRIAALNGTKIENYYILDVDTDNDKVGIPVDAAKTVNMVSHEKHNLLDHYHASCDAYNFRLCKYTDGVNSYVCPSGPEEETGLFAPMSFALYASTPQYYLSEYFDYVPENSGLYQMFTKSDLDRTADGWFTDDHMIFDTLDMQTAYVGFDTSQDLVEKVNSKVVYEQDYEKDGFDKKTYNSYYTVILRENSETINKKLSYNISGTGADMYVTDAEGNRIESGTNVQAGTPLVLWVKSEEGAVVESLTENKYNDISKPDVPTSTEEILKRETFPLLPLDTQSGYHKFDFIMPYSDTCYTLVVNQGYHVDYQNALNDTAMTFKNHSNAFYAGDTVEFIYDGWVESIYMATSDGITKITAEYNKRLDCSTGSFQMPSDDVVLLVTEESFEEGDADILKKDEEGRFLVSNPHDLRIVSVLADTEIPEYKNGAYVLTADIDMTGGYWAPIDSFSGTFDGNSFVIKGLGAENGMEDGSRHPLFGVIEKNGIVRNLTLDGAQVFSNEYLTNGAGAVAKRNEGTIENSIVKNSSVQLGNWNGLGGIAGFNSGIIRNCGVADTSITRRWGGSNTQAMGGITQINSGQIENCFAYNLTLVNGTSSNGAVISSGTDPVNTYYFVENYSGVEIDGTKEMLPEAFASGEVTYLLNRGVTDGTQSFYQHLGVGGEAYPSLTNLRYPVYLVDGAYTNSNRTSQKPTGSTDPEEEETRPLPEKNPDSVLDTETPEDKDVVETGAMFKIYITAAFVLAAAFLLIRIYRKESESKA